MYRYPNYDHLIAGLNSAIAQADQMDLATAQTVDSITRALQRETEALDQIDVVHHQINQTGQVSIRDMNKVESIVSGTIDRAGGAQLFSFNPTTNNLEGAVEAINWAKIGKIGIIGAIVAAILAIIYKIFKFMKSGKVDEIAKDIIEDQKKTEKSFNKAIVIPAIKRSGEMSIGDQPKPGQHPDDFIDLDEPIDEIMRKLNTPKKSEVKKSPEELRKEKRYGNKLDISIPKTTAAVNERLGTKFKESDLQKGFEELLDSMNGAYMGGDVISDKYEVAEMVANAKSFLLDNVPKFKERKPSFAIMVTYLMPSEFSVGATISREENVAEFLQQMKNAENFLAEMAELSGNYKESFYESFKDNVEAVWFTKREAVQKMDISSTIGDYTQGDRSKVAEDIVKYFEKYNYEPLKRVLDNIAKGNFQAEEDNVLVGLEKKIGEFKRLAETFEEPVKKIEKNVAEANKWLEEQDPKVIIERDNLVPGGSLEARIKFAASSITSLKRFMNEILSQSRKLLSRNMAYMNESQSILSHCMSGKGFHHELSETANFIAMSMSKEIASRVSND